MAAPSLPSSLRGRLGARQLQQIVFVQGSWAMGESQMLPSFLSRAFSDHGRHRRALARAVLIHQHN